MCKHYVVILTLLKIINLSVQQSCGYSCVSDALSDENCVKKYEINAYATIINETEGIIDFKFDFGCHVISYKIVIYYNKNICSDFVQYSTYRFRKIQYSNGVNIDKCEENGRVLLQDIQTGCYKIKILDQNNFVIYTNFSYWQTSYMKQEIDLFKTDCIHDSRNNGTELILTIRNSILNYYPDFSLQFECDNCSKYLSEEHVYNLQQNEIDAKKLVLNPKDNNTYLNISCDLKQNETEDVFASCVISPVTVGYYNVVITFVGDPYKCAYNEPNFVRFKNIVVEADELLQLPPSSNSFEVIIGLILGVICILLLFCVIMLIIKLTKLNIRKFDKNTNSTNISVVHVTDGSYLRENEIKPNLLLLYARNSEDMMTTLSSFRNILMHQGIQVFDIYDPANLIEINENSFNWILNLTARKDTKILIFLTPSARNLSNLPQIQDSIDTLYPFAIKHLLTRISNDTGFYKKIFVAHFSNDAHNYSDYDLFSPNLRFRVPDDLMALLQRILNTQQISSND